MTHLSIEEINDITREHLILVADVALLFDGEVFL